MVDLKSATEVTRLTILTGELVNVRFVSCCSICLAGCLVMRRDATLMVMMVMEL